MSDNPYAGLQLSQLIDLLEPMPEPARPSLMPQTGGWIVLGLVLLGLIAFAVYKYSQHRRQNAYRRFALDAISSAGDDPVALARILRLTALSAYPREDIAGLKGVDWLQFLDTTGKLEGFVHGPGQSVATAPYVAAPRPDPALTALVKAWVRQHKPLEAES